MKPTARGESLWGSLPTSLRQKQTKLQFIKIRKSLELEDDFQVGFLSFALFQAYDKQQQGFLDFARSFLSSIHILYIYSSYSPSFMLANIDGANLTCPEVSLKINY